MQAIRILMRRFNKATVVSVHKVLQKGIQPFDSTGNGLTVPHTQLMTLPDKRLAQSASCSHDNNLSSY